MSNHLPYRNKQVDQLFIVEMIRNCWYFVLVQWLFSWRYRALHKHPHNSLWRKCHNLCFIINKTSSVNFQKMSQNISTSNRIWRIFTCSSFFDYDSFPPIAGVNYFSSSTTGICLNSTLWSDVFSIETCI